MDKNEAIGELNSFEKDVVSKKLSADKLCYIYFQIPHIVNDSPDLAPQAFKVLDKAIQSDKNNRYSVEDFYSCLISMVDKRPELVPSAVDVFEKAIFSDQNDIESLKIAQKAFSTFTQKQPDCAAKMSKIMIDALNAYEKRRAPKNSLHKLWRRLNDLGKQEYERKTLDFMKGAALKAGKIKDY